MKKTILFLLFSVYSFGQIQQTFQYTGDPNHFPSLNSFFNTVETSLDSAINDTDLVKTVLSYPTPYTIDALDGTLTVNNSPTQSNTNKIVATLLQPSVNEILYKKGDIGRTFVVLGYNNSTSICVLVLSWASGNIFGRVVNYNLSNGVLSNVIASTLVNMTTNQSGSVKIVGDTIEVYKDGVLTLTYDYTNISSLGGWVNNRCLGFGFHSYGTTGVATVTNGKNVVTEAYLKGETIVSHPCIFPQVKDNEISKENTYSSSQIENLVFKAIKNKRVGVLGDSNSMPLMVNGVDMSYVGILARKHNWTVIRNAVGGRSLSLKAGEPSFVDAGVLESLGLNGAPDIILINGGTNDFLSDQIPLGTINDTDLNTFYGNEKYLIPRAKELYPFAQIFQITPLQTGNTIYSSGYPQINPIGVSLPSIVKAIKEVCGLNDVEVIDTFYKSGINHKTMTDSNDLSTDKVHLTAKGHEIWAEQIERTLINKL